ncbi:Fic family protein [Rhizobium leguminosarum]|uniref:Fic family protein n=1 Tax=Rhizobium TaxID=379 RepID=UPI0002F8246D|nr:Fic family protein [Rhizobium leguminosarum]
MTVGSVILNIEPEAKRLFAQLASREYLAQAGKKDAFAEDSAWFLAEINAIHPFREGNGRIQLVFLTILARNAGYEIDEDQLRPGPFLQAIIKSFHRELAALVNEIRRMI